MSYVESRNQKRSEEIKMIRALLRPKGDLVRIKEAAGVSYTTVQATLSEHHPLYSEKVIRAAWELINKRKNDQ